MRISLLLKREPFGEILERTLESFLPNLTGTEHHVQWAERPAALIRSTTNGSTHQVWVCNPYLNAIFSRSAKATVLEPVIKEFRRSTVRWRRPLQSAYVSVAVSKTLSSMIGNRSLVVSPEIPDGDDILIVGGNHKIRLIQKERGTAYGIRKHGFTDRFIRREVEARRTASQFRISTPELLDVAHDFSWFKESYLSGTPINRLPENSAKKSLKEAIRQLQGYYEATRRPSSAAAYAGDLGQNCRALIAKGGTKEFQVAKKLQRFISSHAELAIETSASHGDFQPANILQNESGTWLIDWEYSTRRQLGYDLLVYAAGSRTAKGLAQRLSTLFASSNNWILNTIDNPLWLTAQGQRISIALFLLEELQLRLEESCSSPVLRRDSALDTLCAEINSWLNSPETASARQKPPVAVLNQMAGPMGWDTAEALGKQRGSVPLLTGHPDILKRGSNEYVNLNSATPYDRRSFPRRIISWLRYLLQAFFWVLRLPKETSLLLYSNPPMLPWLGYLMHVLRGQRYAVMIWDIYPDILVRKQVLSARNPVVRLWYWLNRKSYENADVVMTLGEYMAGNLAKQFDAGKTRTGKVEVIYPWVDTENIKPIPKEENWFAKKYNQVGKLTVMYSGNMGYGHDIETMLAAAERLQDQRDIHFMFIGDGPKWKLVDRRIKDKELGNVTLLPWQPEEVLPYSLATADVALVSIEEDIAGLMLPSKAFSFLAEGTPLIVLSKNETGLANVARDYGCCRMTRPGHVEQLCSTVLSLSSAPSDLQRLKRQSRTASEKIGSRANILQLQRLVGVDLG